MKNICQDGLCFWKDFNYAPPQKEALDSGVCFTWRCCKQLTTVASVCSILSFLSRISQWIDGFKAHNFH
jgi:hypothetical protein